MKTESFLAWRGRDAEYWLSVMAIVCGLINLGVAVAIDVAPLEPRLRAVHAAGGSAGLMLYTVADAVIPSNWTMGVCLIFMGVGTLWLRRGKRDGSVHALIDTKTDVNQKGE